MAMQQISTKAIPKKSKGTMLVKSHYGHISMVLMGLVYISIERMEIETKYGLMFM